MKRCLTALVLLCCLMGVAGAEEEQPLPLREGKALPMGLEPVVATDEEKHEMSAAQLGTGGQAESKPAIDMAQALHFEGTYVDRVFGNANGRYRRRIHITLFKLEDGAYRAKIRRTKRRGPEPELVSTYELHHGVLMGRNLVFQGVFGEEVYFHLHAHPDFGFMLGLGSYENWLKLEHYNQGGKNDLTMPIGLPSYHRISLQAPALEKQTKTD